MPDTKRDTLTGAKQVRPYIENISEATAACLFTMVQGNVLALGLSHLYIAAQTGIFAGILAAAVILFAKLKNRKLVSLLLAVVTAVVDYFVHPGMFGSVATEPLVTGAAAGILSYIFSFGFSKFRKSQDSSEHSGNDMPL